MRYEILIQLCIFIILEHGKCFPHDPYTTKIDIFYIKFALFSYLEETYGIISVKHFTPTLFNFNIFILKCTIYNENGHFSYQKFVLGAIRMHHIH